MTQWIAISKTEHAQSLYWPRDGYHFASDQQVVPVLLAELGKLLPHYALGFIEEGEAYQPVALTGLGNGNLYVTPNGKWLGSYVPAAMRAYPFRLANNEQGDKVLCMDQAQVTDEPSATPLFADDGQLAKQAAQALDFLKQCEQNRQVTQACVAKLSEAGVIEEWPLQIGRGEGQEPLKVNGLHRINEKALNALEAEGYATLRGGPMALAHAQLFSMGQLHQLAERAKFHAKQAGSQPPENLDSLFEDDDELTFDFGD